MIKRLLRQTPLYTMLTRYRARRDARSWSEDDEKMKRLYRQFLNEGDVCFDIGANVGNRAKIFLALRARVIAVEPQELCASLLTENFGSESNFHLVRKVLGPQPGEAELKVSTAHTVSSLSSEWIDAVKNSGRFSDQSWDRVETVEMTTLDELIAAYGIPSFVKIDVEGFELEVIRGLSTKIKALSLEFTPEFLHSTFACLDHLSSLGELETNLSYGESHELHLEQWTDPLTIRTLLGELRGESSVFGDVYVRFRE